MIQLNKTYSGNCLELINNLDDNSIDCVITSPPYFNSSHKYQRGNGFHYSNDVGAPMYVIMDFFELVKNKFICFFYFYIKCRYCSRQ